MKLNNTQLLDLGKKYDLPLFVYDGELIAEKYIRFKNAFSVEKLRINYACKALTNLSILRLMHKLGAGIDAVSIGEIKMAMEAGFPSSRILFTPNAVNDTEIEAALELGVGINIDNLPSLEYFGKKYKNFSCCVRVNPHIMAGGNANISVGHIDSKFGISIHQIKDVHRISNELDLKIIGLHMHTGSDILEADTFIQASNILFDQAKQFEDLEFIDFGSGFKVKYHDSDYETDIENLGKVMSSRFNEFCQEYGKTLELIFEPGKYLVSESGYFLTETNIVKRSPTTLFACINSGFNHLIRPMFYGSKHFIENASNPTGSKRVYDVVGYICETDTFAHKVQLSEVRKGDVLVFHNAGAYCFSMSSNYNSRERPPEVLIYEGIDYLIRKREVFEDLLVGQLIPEVLLD